MQCLIYVYDVILWLIINPSSDYFLKLTGSLELKRGALYYQCGRCRKVKNFMILLWVLLNSVLECV